MRIGFLPLTSRKKYYLLILLAIVFCPDLSFGQNTNFALPQITPPSPNAASLGKYADFPVSNYTGTPNISIPLYEVKEGRISLPITLNYHASGIKVEEEASWVGLGWSLDAGGVVTKSIFGKDDESINGYFQTPPLPDPYSPLQTNSFILGGTNYYMSPVKCQPICNGQPYDYRNILTGLSNYDFQPDRYYFNFSGVSGKFMLDKNREAFLFDQQKVKIVQSGGFIITTANGTRYEFTTGENSFDGLTSQLQGTSWYLTKIVSPVGDQIDFTYQNVGTIRSQPSLSEFNYYNSNPAGPQSGTRRSYADYQSVVLSKIQWSQGQILFERDSQERQDVTVANRLKKVKIYNTTAASPGSESLIKEYELSSSYFVSPNTSTNYSQTTDAAYAKVDKRLRLDSLTERNNTVKKPAYVFTYNPTVLPFKTSYARDHWGYFNGATGNTTLIPPFKGELLEPIGQNTLYYDLPGANREPDESSMKACILEKIIFPTGGYTRFEYEQHEGIYDGPGGIRKTVRVPHTALIAGIANVFQQQETTFTGFSGVEPISQACKVTITFQGTGLDGTFLYNDVRWQIFEDNQLKQTWFGEPAPTSNYSYSRTFSFSIVKGKTYKLLVSIPVSQKDKIIEAKMVLEEISYDPNQLLKLGGLRISKMIDYDGIDHAKDKIRVFQYDQGKLMSYPWYSRSYETMFDYRNSQGGVDFWSRYITLELTSSSNIPLGSAAQGSHVGYGKVTVLNGLNGQFGKSEFTYHNMGEKYTIYPERPTGLPTFPDLLNGSLLQQEDYSLSQKVRQVKNTYELVNRRGILGVIGEKRLNGSNIGDELRYTTEMLLGYCSLSTSSSFNPGSIFHYYEIPSGWIQLTKSEETLYDQKDPNRVFTTVSSYEYDNPVHYQPTRVSVTNSKNQRQLTYTTYPEDYADNSGFIKDLKDAFIVNVPIEQVTLKETIGIAGSRVVTAGVVNTYKPGSQGLKDVVYSLKNTASIPVSGFKFSNKPANQNDLSGNANNSVFQMDPSYERRILYEQYTNKGNIAQMKKTDNIPITYLWGYYNQYPVAEIKNATYSQVKAALGVAAGSQIDLGGSGLSSAQRQQIQNQLPQAFITTYTYDPLVGMTSQTGSDGITVFYEYDKLQRLKVIKDQQGNIVKRYQYHYTGQPQPTE